MTLSFHCLGNFLTILISEIFCAKHMSIDGIMVSETMESRLVPGLYFAGEILDVDGACGGYNLQWAWSSGYLAGYHAANDQKGQVEQNA